MLDLDLLRSSNYIHFCVKLYTSISLHHSFFLVKDRRHPHTYILCKCNVRQQEQNKPNLKNANSNTK